MNHPHRPESPGRRPMPLPRPARPVVVVVIVSALCLWLAGGLIVPSAALGQRSGGGGGLPSDLKTAADATPRQAEIEKFISAQVAKLQKGKESDRQAARALLARESGGAGVAPSESYLRVYATVLNKQLEPLAKHPDAHVRLNSAIALQRAAAKANNAALAPAAARFTRDARPGVALWGAKAAQFILPAVAAAGKRSDLTAALVEAVRKNPDSAELTEEAYRALTLDVRTNPKRLNAQAVPVLLPDALKLFELRVSQYAKSRPPAPDLDQTGAIFLTIGPVWDHPAAAKLRPAIMQQLSNLIGFAAQHAAAREGDDREAFINLLRNSGDALAVVGASAGVKDANIQAAAKSLTDVTVKADGEELTTMAEEAHAAIKAKFADTRPAPEIAAEAAGDAEDVEEMAPDQPPARAPRGDDTTTGTGDEDAGSAPPPSRRGDAVPAGGRPGQPSRKSAGGGGDRDR